MDFDSTIHNEGGGNRERFKSLLVWEKDSTSCSRVKKVSRNKMCKIAILVLGSLIIVALGAIATTAKLQPGSVTWVIAGSIITILIAGVVFSILIRLSGQVEVIYESE